jgi:hypothetical protein
MPSLRASTTALGLAVVTAASTTLVAPAPSATAKGGDAVIARGSCSERGDWKLKAKQDDGRIEVELEVDTNRAGQTFRVRMWDNGDRFFAGRRTTKAPSGSFSLERRTANRAGPDTVRARAVRGDNVCTGRVTV